MMLVDKLAEQVTTTTQHAEHMLDSVIGAVLQR